MDKTHEVLDVSGDVAESNRAEQALRESEARYRQMFEKNRAIKLLVDPESGDIVQANPAACDFYQYSAEQLHQMKIWQLNLMPEKEVRAKMAQAMSGSSSNFVFRHRLASGQVRDVEVSASPIDIQGRRLIYSIVHDITERRQAERALWHHTKRLQILHDIDQAILAVKSPGEIAHAALGHLRQVVPARHASVMLFDYDTGQVEVLAVNAAGPTQVRAGDRIPLEVAWSPGEQWRNNLYSIDDLAAAPDSSPAAETLQAEGIRAYLSVPLIAQGHLIGRLRLGAGNPGAFMLQHLDIARQVADSLAVAIQNGRLYEGEQHARQTAETLRAANVALTQSLDLDAVFEMLLDYLRRLVPFDSACVMLTTKDDGVQVRAVSGYDQWADAEHVQALEGMQFDIEATPTIATVLGRQESFLVADTANYPDWQPRPGSEHVRSWLGVPLIAQGRCIGLCSIDKAETNFFSEDHVRLAEALAAQAAVAILNARLFEEVREGRQQLQTLSRRLVDIQERERRRVVRELHDGAGQALTSLMVGLGLLERDGGCSEPVNQQLEDLKHTVDGVLEDLHRLAVDLRPATLDHLGLIAALRQHVESVQRQSDLRVEFETIGLNGERLAQETETSLYRIVQEALTNVIRHAQATQAGVLLERRGDRVVAIIEDDGVGFDAEEAMRRGRQGLVGMRERAEMLGGTLMVESARNIGTSIFVEIPYEPR